MPVPLPGTPCPDFEVSVLTPSMKFETRRLKDYAGKYLVVFFYPLDFTFVCPSEIIHFAELSTFLRSKCNAEIIIGSTDSVYSHYAWCLQGHEEGGIGACKCDLFADTNHKMARDFGVLIEDQGIALRGLFIVSDKGLIRHVCINDLPVGRSIEECKRLVQAFQYADKTGGDIPCGWTPENNATINPDPEKKKEYFSKAFKK
ncbi:Peroxiredoxin 1 [Giardia muris]|uniref:Peroxiredoxin 1 n=1 Tax=Giardia muris TaxID=5742 RepID=A0A3S5GR53_GIAMU|nr:Peroxiredoxin 1 [Giardia muris]AXQ17153.1 Peroxiredoxin 1 [Giardia muris]TNJ26791.1 Peroxiredoxin 1 [Giardia muris]TNJ26798.1 Peroxiredoxin 1 [Giardia muris]|eukprot:TNJ26791.1 Peroxiredoxin 1 [Giardia muris]